MRSVFRVREIDAGRNFVRRGGAALPRLFWRHSIFALPTNFNGWLARAAESEPGVVGRGWRSLGWVTFRWLERGLGFFGGSCGWLMVSGMVCANLLGTVFGDMMIVLSVLNGVLNYGLYFLETFG